MVEISSRKSKIVIMDKVLEQISKKELTINEIADKIESHWLTVRETINFLLKYKLIEEVDFNGDKKYKSCKGIVREETTYYHIPVESSIKDLAFFVFEGIKEKWLKAKEKPINKTFLQKIAVDVIEKINLPIPCGWYKFGKITIFNVDPSVDYGQISKPNNSSEIESQINKSVEEFSKYEYTWEVREHQYREHNMIQYQINENLRLISSRMIDLSTKNNRKALPTQLNLLKSLIPDNQYTKEIKLVLLNFISSINSYLADENFKINAIKSQIYDAYKSIWDLIATYNFCESISQYESYDKETIKSYFMIFIDEKLVNAKDRVNEIELIS